MKKFFLAALLGLLFTSPTFAAWNSGANCPAGYIDTVGWLGPNPGQSVSIPPYTYYAHNSHNTNMAGSIFMGELWSSQGGASGKEFIIKDTAGDAWDENYWDSTYWYYYVTTEDSRWGDPSAVKAFSPPVPAMKRCEPAGTAGYPTKLDSLTTYNNHVIVTQGNLPPYGAANNAYGCWALSNVNVGTITMETWGPYQYQIGAESAPLTTYVLAYYYNWNGSVYLNRELEFFQSPGVGWAYWEHDNWNGGGWTMDNSTEFAEIASGIPSNLANPCGY